MGFAWNRGPTVPQGVVFLDIDGVLAPIRAWDRYGELDAGCVQALNEIVARTGAEIVVTSSLRYGRSVAELQALLAARGFSGLVVDATPTDLPGASRGDEIAAWLRDHPVERWVILDDHRDVGELRTWLVQTQPAVGLQTA